MIKLSSRGNLCISYFHRQKCRTQKLHIFWTTSLTNFRHYFSKNKVRLTPCVTPGMYVSSQCNFLDIISFSFKLGGGGLIFKNDETCVSWNACSNVSEIHQVNCGIYWNSCTHKLLLDMPVCNNTTSVRTQKLHLTETFVFRSSPVQISTGTTVTDIFMAALTPSTKCCVVTTKWITLTSLYTISTTLFMDHPTVSHYTEGSSHLGHYAVLIGDLFLMHRRLLTPPSWGSKSNLLLL